MDYLVDVLCKLVRIPTIAPERRDFDRMVNFLEEECRKIGLEVEIVEVENGIKHIMAYFPNADRNGKKLLILAHYDVVPPGDGWKFDPFEPRVEDGKVYGRGAADDKSSIAAMLAAAKEVLEQNLKVKNNPVFVFTGGEEVGETEPFLKKLNGDYAIVLDGYIDKIEIAASGLVNFKVKIYGKQAHSAYPYKGDNAIYKAARVVLELEKYGKWLEENKKSNIKCKEGYDYVPARLSVTIFKAGWAHNVIPGEAEFIINRRTHPEESLDMVEKETKEKLKEIFEKLGINKYEIETITRFPGFVCKDMSFAEKFKNLVEKVLGEKYELVGCLGGVDGAYLADRMPVVIFGAMREENNIHGANEFVYIEDLRKLKEIVKEILTGFTL